MPKLQLTTLLLLLSCFAFAGDTVRVSNAESFLSAIRSERVIILESDSFQISRIHFVDSVQVNRDERNDYSESVYYQSGINIHDVSNLVIMTAEHKRKAVITSHYSMDGILNFYSCKNIKLEGVELNHNPETKGWCSGGVLYFKDCENIRIRESILRGSGRSGIDGMNITNMKCEFVKVIECSSHLFEFFDCTNLKFKNCEFSRIRNLGQLIFLNNCFNVMFKECLFEYNLSDTEHEFYEEDNSYLIKFIAFRGKGEELGTGIKFIECTFRNNGFREFTNRPTQVSLESCEFEDDELMESSVKD